VAELQRRLTRLGYPLSDDGVYGHATKRAVRRYERRHRLYLDGKVGPREARGIVRRDRARRRRLESASTTGTTSGDRAVIGPDGLHALAPESAPPKVKAAIAAANRIVGKPYVYGGGHGSFEDSGYDCSGTVSYALHGGTWLDTPEDSSTLESFGARHHGQWVSVYANSGHAYMVIAGLRLDTSGPGPSGPRWRPQHRSKSGYVVRHPRGF
jgi:peptidoglycan hydrolase-like protein with peptidoglycan-binding domain